MKNLRLILVTTIILFFYNFAFSQALVKEGHQWNTRFQSFSSPAVNTGLLQMRGDTLIGDTIYTKLYSTQDTFEINWKLIDVAMREDSTGKVYARRYGDELETLEYDFNLELNDVFNFSSYCDYEVYQIDSITINNGERRKQIHLRVAGETSDFGPRWVEGIGDLNGGLLGNRGYCIFDVGSELLCFYDNEELLYPESPATCFDEKIVSVRNELPADIAIYPNPMSDVLNVNYNSTVLKFISIVEIMGKEVYKGPYMREVDVSSLGAGTYFLLLEDSVGNVYVDKLLKLE